MSALFLGLLILVAVVLIFWWGWMTLAQESMNPSGHKASPAFASHVAIQKQNINGLEMAYIDIGRGRPFVLVHGLGASSYCFRFLIPLLQSQGRVIALDLVGFGQSEKSSTASYDVGSQVDRLEAFFEALHIKKAVLVGSSMGGLLCLHLAKRRPDLVAEQILLSPSLFVRTFLPRSLLRAGRLVIRSFLNEKTLVHFLKRIVVRHDLIDDMMIKSYLEPLTHESSPYALVESLKSIADPRWTRDLENASGPLLILWGKHDKILPVSLIRKISRLIPNAKFEIHPDGGHHIQEDDPVWVSLKIFSHLNEGL